MCGTLLHTQKQIVLLQTYYAPFLRQVSCILDWDKNCNLVVQPRHNILGVSQNQECKEWTCVLGENTLVVLGRMVTRWRAHRMLLTVWDNVFLLVLCN